MISKKTEIVDRSSSLPPVNSRKNPARLHLRTLPQMIQHRSTETRRSTRGRYSLNFTSARLSSTPSVSDMSQIAFVKLPGMGDIRKTAQGSRWSKGGEGESRPNHSSLVLRESLHPPARASLRRNQNESEVQRTSASRIGLKNGVAKNIKKQNLGFPFYDIKGMGSMIKKKGHGLMLSRTPRLPLPYSEGPTKFYTIKGMGACPRKEGDSTWARQRSNPPLHPNKPRIREGGNLHRYPSNPLYKIPNASRASFTASGY